MKMKRIVEKRSLGILRGLTLVCFFNFSGIHNGFSYFVEASGRLESVDLTADLLRPCFEIFNPFSWKRAVADPLYRRFCAAPARALERASRNAVENILAESFLVQVWLQQNCGDWVQASGVRNPEPSGSGRGPAVSSRSRARTGVFGDARPSVDQRVAEVKTSALNACRRLISRNDFYAFREEGPAHLSSAQRWFLKQQRALFKGGGTSPWGEILGRAGPPPGLLSARKKGFPAGGPPLPLGVLLGFLIHRMRNRSGSSEESSGEGRCAAAFAREKLPRLFARRGFFFAGVGAGR